MRLRYGLLPLVGATVAACGGAASDSGDVHFPVVLSSPEVYEAVTVVWTFTEEDCLRCQSFPDAVRSSRAQVGRATIGFVAVLVADQSVSWIDEYLDRTRLFPRRVRVTQEELANLLGDVATTRLYLVKDRRVLRSFEPYPRPPTDEIEAAIIQLVASGLN